MDVNMLSDVGAMGVVIAGGSWIIKRLFDKLDAKEHANKELMEQWKISYEKNIDATIKHTEATAGLTSSIQELRQIIKDSHI